MTERRNWGTAAAVLLWVPLVLVADHVAGTRPSALTTQGLLGVGTWLLLIGLLVKEPMRIRVQVAVVVGFATLVEYAFSYELHIYVYRLHNVPMFVPPGHGLVYLGALAIGRSTFVTARARVLIPATIVGCGGYAAWGIFVSSRQDLLGVLWFGCLVFFLLRGRQPTVFVGAFVVVTYLELIGTHLGVWTWQVKDPVAHIITMGNPPSGAAGGYGFFDAAALAIAGGLEAALGRRRQRRKDAVVQQTVAAHQVAAVGALDA